MLYARYSQLDIRVSPQVTLNAPAAALTLTVAALLASKVIVLAVRALARPLPPSP